MIDLIVTAEHRNRDESPRVEYVPTIGQIVCAEPRAPNKSLKVNCAMAQSIMAGLILIGS